MVAQRFYGRRSGEGRDKSNRTASAAWAKAARRGMLWDCVAIIGGFVIAAFGMTFDFGIWMIWICGFIALARGMAIGLGRGGFWIRKPDKLQYLANDIAGPIEEAWSDALSARIAFAIYCAALVAIIAIFASY